MYRRSTFAALAAILINVFSAHAEQDEAAIVVTATRQPSRISALAADISVIERSQIEAAGPAATLGDLLATVPGVELSRQGSRGAGENIFIRGANAGHTLVLVDGLRAGSATLGQTAIEAIPLAQVERVEILRGPASALYGSDAIGGVIRVTTRQGEDAPRLDARIGAGSHGSQEALVSHAGRAGALRYAIRAGDSRATGVSAITNPSSAAYNADKDGYWRRHLALDVAWRSGEATEMGMQWLDSDGMSRHDASWPNAASDWQNRHSVSALAVHGRHRLSKSWTAEVRLGRSEDDSITTPSSTAGQASDNYRTRQDQFSWQNDLGLPVGRGLVALESLREGVLSTKAYTSVVRSTDSLVLGWNGSVDAHVWQAGARRDENSQFGGKTTHTLNYGYRFLPGWKASAGVGTSFKAPTLNDLYYPNTPFEGVGNPGLVPESGRSREIALHYYGKIAEASLTVFRNDIRNLIQWEETSPGSWFYTPSNIGSARITGLTAAGKTRLGEWSVDGHLTLQSPKNRSNGEYLTRRALRFGGVSASRMLGNWNVGAEFQGAGHRYDAPDFTTRRNTRVLTGYNVVHLRGEYRLDPQWSMLVRIDNLLDEQYELARSSTTNYASLGRFAFVGMRFVMK